MLRSKYMCCIGEQVYHCGAVGCWSSWIPFRAEVSQWWAGLTISCSSGRGCFLFLAAHSHHWLWMGCTVCLSKLIQLTKNKCKNSCIQRTLKRFMYTCIYVSIYMYMCVHIALWLLSLLVQEGADCWAKIDNREGDGQMESLSPSVFVYSVYCGALPQAMYFEQVSRTARWN